jgi:DNA polymerase III epsilon subunit-like protein
MADEYATLVKPDQPIGRNGVHGLTQGDVTDAPTFAEIAGDVLERLRLDLSPTSEGESALDDDCAPAT